MRRAGQLLALLALALASGCARREPPGPHAAAQAPTPARWGYVGGRAVTRADAEVKGTQDKAIYLNERYSMTAYRIPVANGTYVVRLHFAETYEGIRDVGQRVFSVAVEGKPALADLDVFREAGKQTFTAFVKELQAEVNDGELTIEFTPKVQNPMINGIEVQSAGTRRAGGTVLLINCGATADYTAKDGRTWRKDQEYQAP